MSISCLYNLLRLIFGSPNTFNDFIVVDHDKWINKFFEGLAYLLESVIIKHISDTHKYGLAG